MWDVVVLGAGLGGLLLANRLGDRKVLLVDRRRWPGKKCTGIVSEETFRKLGVSRDYVDSRFREIEVQTDRSEVYFRVEVVRLNRFKLEKDLSDSLKVVRPVNGEIMGDRVKVGNQLLRTVGVRATGWQGKGCRWLKAVEISTEPLSEENVKVFLDSRNVGGFSWIVPLADRALVGAVSYGDPELFLPKLNKRVIERHGGAIPRVNPKPFSDLRIGDSTGLVKTFTGGGIFSISEILNPLVSYLNGEGPKLYNETLRKLRAEVRRQYILTRSLELSWSLALKGVRLPFNSS
jgi:flavin-dependent dehydrogenase